jgi:AcrR family transcriptional regulator
VGSERQGLEAPEATDWPVSRRGVLHLARKFNQRAATGWTSAVLGAEIVDSSRFLGTFALTGQRQGVHADGAHVIEASAMGKAERRIELLRAARDVFAEKGYHDAKVDDIVLKGKVAKGTFYLYFRDKRSVFSELVDGLFERLAAAILTVDTATDVEAQVKHNIRAIIAVLLDDPALTRLLLSYAGGLDPAFVTKVESFYDGAKALLRASLEEGQRLGIVAKGDA